LAETESESKTESGVWVSVDAKCLPKVRWYFRPKTKPKPKVDRTRTQSRKETNQYTVVSVA